MCNRFRNAFVAGLLLCAGLALFGSPALATLTTTIIAQIQAHYAGTNDLGAPTFDLKLSLQPNIGLSSGTSTGQADRMFADTRTLAASATENLDLAGVLTDPLGATLTCVKVKAIMVRAAAANTNNVLVGGAASNTFVGPFADATDIVGVQPGGIALFVAPGAGWTVTAGTGDILKVANSSSGTGVTYDVIIICTSA